MTADKIQIDRLGVARLRLSPTDWLIIGCVATWAAAIAAAIWSLPVLHAPLRVLLTALAVALGIVILRGPSRPLILSPFYILSLFALVLYSLVPALYVEIRHYIPTNVIKDIRLLAFNGSLGEMLVLQFVAFCLLFTASAMKIVRFRLNPDAAAQAHGIWTKISLCAAALILLFTAIPLLAAGWPALQKFLSHGVGREVSDAFYPLTSLCISTLVYVAALRKGRFLVLAAAVIFTFLGVKLFTDVVQIPIFITLCALLLLAVIGYNSVRSVAAAGGFMLALIIVAGVIVAGVRYSVFDFTKPHTSLKTSLVSKLIYRQGDSAWCFNWIAKTHLRQDRSGNPFYFATAIVPRVFWPGKPNLSRGKEFGLKYCDATVNPGDQHVELITLMGEPIIEAGLAGLIVAQLFLGIGLFLVTVFAFHPGRGNNATRLIALVAMLPWLAHFQQHFALFFAGAVKSFIIMAPLIVILAYCERRSRA